MAASAKEKAYNLKDSYVAGLIEGGATAPAPSMPTQNMGEQASLVRDIDRMEDVLTNDMDPFVYLKKGGKMHRMHNPNERWLEPVNGGGDGARVRKPMKPGLVQDVNNAFDAWDRGERF